MLGIGWKKFLAGLVIVAGTAVGLHGAAVLAGFREPRALSPRVLDGTGFFALGLLFMATAVAAFSMDRLAYWEDWYRREFGEDDEDEDDEDDEGGPGTPPVDQPS